MLELYQISFTRFSDALHSDFGGHSHYFDGNRGSSIRNSLLTLLKFFVIRLMPKGGVLFPLRRSLQGRSVLEALRGNGMLNWL